jgi:hypothetical protein
MIGPLLKIGCCPKRLWRPLIGVIVAYAVAAQSLLIVLGGFSLPAQTNERVAAFELCLHDGQAAPDQPAGNPDRSVGCTHCIFCFAGSHSAVIGAPTVVVQRAYADTGEAPWAADKHALPHFPAHSIANPRGPPLRA